LSATPILKHPGLRAGLLIAALLALSPSPWPADLADAFRRAEAASAAGQFAAAADALNMAAARLPDDAETLERAGAADLAAGRFESAVRRLQRAGDLGGWTPARRVRLGDAYQGLGDPAAATEQWEQALNELPDNDAILSRLAASYEAAGRYPDAIAMLTRRVQAGAIDPALIYRLALLTTATAPAEASGWLTQAASLSSEFAPQAERLRRAIAAAQAQEDEAYLYGRAGYELIQMQEWALAGLALTQAVALNPAYADAHAYLGLALDMQGQDGAASYRRAVELAPESPLTQFLFGLHYRRLGQAAQALPYLEAAQKLDPANPAIAAEMGGAYAALNDLPQAEHWFSEAVRLAPRDAQFWLLLARFHLDYDWKVPELGLPAARQAVGLDAESAAAHDTLGFALVLTGDLLNGEESLKRALQLDPELASAYYHLGRLYLQQDKTAEARAALEQAVTLDPDGPYGNLALRALASLPP